MGLLVSSAWQQLEVATSRAEEAQGTIRRLDAQRTALEAALSQQDAACKAAKVCSDSAVGLMLRARDAAPTTPAVFWRRTSPACPKPPSPPPPSEKSLIHAKHWCMHSWHSLGAVTHQCLTSCLFKLCFQTLRSVITASSGGTLPACI